MAFWKKKELDGQNYFVSTDPSQILKKMDSYHLSPVSDEHRLLEEGDCLGAIILLANGIDNNLRYLYLFKKKKTLLKDWVDLQKTGLDVIIEKARGNKIITPDEEIVLKKLVVVRNILAHDIRTHPRYIDPKKAEVIVNSCTPILDKLHNLMVDKNKK